MENRGILSSLGKGLAPYRKAAQLGACIGGGLLPGLWFIGCAFHIVTFGGLIGGKLYEALGWIIIICIGYAYSPLATIYDILGLAKESTEAHLALGGILGFCLTTVVNAVLGAVTGIIMKFAGTHLLPLHTEE